MLSSLSKNQYVKISNSTKIDEPVEYGVVINTNENSYDIMSIGFENKNGNFLGEITERELIAYGMPNYLSLMEDLNFLTVGEPFEEYLVNESKVTIKNLYRVSNEIVIDRKTPIMEICFIMVNKGITRLYVVDNGKYYGMIKRSDIIKKVLHI